MSGVQPRLSFYILMLDSSSVVVVLSNSQASLSSCQKFFYIKKGEVIKVSLNK